MPMHAVARAAVGKALVLKMFFFMVYVLLFCCLYTLYESAGGFSTESENFLSEFCVVEPGQFYVPGDGGVLPPEHPDVELGIAGKGVFHAAAQDAEPEPYVPDGIVIRGEGNFARQPVRHGLFQHGHIAAVGVEGVQVLAEVGLPLGTESVRIDACA